MITQTRPQVPLQWTNTYPDILGNEPIRPNIIGPRPLMSIQTFPTIQRDPSLLFSPPFHPSYSMNSGDLQSYDLQLGLSGVTPFPPSNPVRKPLFPPSNPTHNPSSARQSLKWDWEWGNDYSRTPTNVPPQGPSPYPTPYPSKDFSTTNPIKRPYQTDNPNFQAALKTLYEYITLKHGAQGWEQQDSQYYLKIAKFFYTLIPTHPSPNLLGTLDNIQKQTTLQIASLMQDHYKSQIFEKIQNFAKFNLSETDNIAACRISHEVMSRKYQGIHSPNDITVWLQEIYVHPMMQGKPNPKSNQSEHFQTIPHPNPNPNFNLNPMPNPYPNPNPDPNPNPNPNPNSKPNPNPSPDPIPNPSTQSSPDINPDPNLNPNLIIDSNRESSPHIFSPVLKQQGTLDPNTIPINNLTQPPPQTRSRRLKRTPKPKHRSSTPTPKLERAHSNASSDWDNIFPCAQPNRSFEITLPSQQPPDPYSYSQFFTPPRPPKIARQLPPSSRGRPNNSLTSCHSNSHEMPTTPPHTGDKNMNLDQTNNPQTLALPSLLVLDPQPPTISNLDLDDLPPNRYPDSDPVFSQTNSQVAPLKSETPQHSKQSPNLSKKGRRRERDTNILPLTQTLEQAPITKKPVHSLPLTRSTRKLAKQATNPDLQPYVTIKPITIKETKNLRRSKRPTKINPLVVPSATLTLRDIFPGTEQNLPKKPINDPLPDINFDPDIETGCDGIDVDRSPPKRKPGCSTSGRDEGNCNPLPEVEILNLPISDNEETSSLSLTPSVISYLDNYSSQYTDITGDLLSMEGDLPHQEFSHHEFPLVSSPDHLNVKVSPAKNLKTNWGSVESSPSTRPTQPITPPKRNSSKTPSKHNVLSPPRPTHYKYEYSSHLDKKLDPILPEESTPLGKNSNVKPLLSIQFPEGGPNAQGQLQHHTTKPTTHLVSSNNQSPKGEKNPPKAFYINMERFKSRWSLRVVNSPHTLIIGDSNLRSWQYLTIPEGFQIWCYPGATIRNISDMLRAANLPQSLATIVLAVGINNCPWDYESATKSDMGKLAATCGGIRPVSYFLGISYSPLLDPYCRDNAILINGAASARFQKQYIPPLHPSEVVLTQSDRAKKETMRRVHYDLSTARRILTTVLDKLQPPPTPSVDNPLRVRRRIQTTSNVLPPDFSL